MLYMLMIISFVRRLRAAINSDYIFTFTLGFKGEASISLVLALRPKLN
jgi:hypothetical protein